MAEYLFKFCLSGEISPNLVTLLGYDIRNFNLSFQLRRSGPGRSNRNRISHRASFFERHLADRQKAWRASRRSEAVVQHWLQAHLKHAKQLCRQEPGPRKTVLHLL